MKKRILSLLLVLFIITSLITATPLMVSAATSGMCGDNVTWNISSDGKLTIKGTGPMTNYSFSRDVPWYFHYVGYGSTPYIKSVEICDGVTSIGSWAFCGASLNSIIISDTVTTLGDYAINGCASLTNITIPKNVTNIGKHVLYQCYNLKEIKVDENNNSFCAIDGSLFNKSKTTLVQYALGKSESKCVLPATVTSIASGAFAHCSNLEKIILPNGLKNIDSQSFSYCYNITDVYYCGSAGEWTNISIGSSNEYLTDAKIHYNYNTSPVSVKTVTLNTDYLTMKVGDKNQLQANCTPNNATDKSLTWSSDNTKVATVNSNGIVTACGVGSANITAKSKNGKSASCIIAVQTQNVIDYDDYGYSFYNSHKAFGYEENYKIPLYRYYQAGYSDAIAFAKYKLNKKWDGSCAGMTISSILFYKNALDEERYKINSTKPSEFGYYDNSVEKKVISSDEYLKLRCMIELFQVAQQMSPTKYVSFSVEEVANEIDNGNPVALELKTGLLNGIGHLVVIHSYEKNDNVYTFNIYDCSDFVHKLIYITKKNWYESDSYSFQRKGIDGNYYDSSYYGNYKWKITSYCTANSLVALRNRLYMENNYNAVSLFSTQQEPTYTYIFRPAEDITITNSFGQMSTIVNSEVLGEIENIKVESSSYLAEEPTYTIILPTDTYTIVGSSDEVITTSFADDYISASVTAKSSTPITISSNLKEISVDAATGEEYDITYTTYDNIFDEMNLSGTATGTVTTKLNDADILVSGVNTLTASASVSEFVVSANSDNLSDNDKITVKCEETDSGATIQILSADTELTDKTSLPERLTVDTPTYDLASGTYTEGQVLNFTKDDETIIYYTTDGSIPSADNGIIYSLPIDINKSMTVKAISTKYGYLDSEVLELNYTLPEVDMPEANIESGEYDKVITVELFTGNYEDTIYYTLDGSNPLENGILYTVPINISEDAYLQAYTLRNGCVSEIGEYEYTVTPAYPFYFSNSLTNQDGEIITPDNIADVTKVKMTLSKLHTGDHTGVFLIAFYGADNRLIYVNYKTATIREDIDEVEIDITENVSSAYNIKAFAWKDLSTIEPICEALEESIIIE